MVANYNMRALVAPPGFTPSPYGLLSAVELRGDTTAHWEMGVSWVDICGGAGVTIDWCDTSAPAITGVGSVPQKLSTTSRTLYGATPFTVYVEVDCSPVDFYDDRDGVISQAMARYESFQVERTFWTGLAPERNNSGGTPNGVLPHLAANTAVVETNLGRPTVLQMAATVVTGVALNVTDALGALEGALAACLNGTGVIHVPQALAPTMALLLEQKGPRLLTPNGNVVAIGAGYPGTSPTGATPASGTSWMYATSALFAYRGPTRIVGDPFQTLDRTTDTMHVIIERTYVLGYDCCLFAQLVNTASFTATSSTGP